MLGIVVALVFGAAVVVGFLLITNSVKEDQAMDFKFKTTLFFILIISDGFIQTDLYLRLDTIKQFDLPTFNSLNQSATTSQNLH